MGMQVLLTSELTRYISEANLHPSLIDKHSSPGLSIVQPELTKRAEKAKISSKREPRRYGRFDF